MNTTSPHSALTAPGMTPLFTPAPGTDGALPVGRRKYPMAKCLLTLLCTSGLFTLANFTLLPPPAAPAQDAPPQDTAWEEAQPATDGMAPAGSGQSSTGRSLLLLTLGLAGLVVGMERLASWQLARAKRAWHDLVGPVPAGSQPLGLYRWGGRQVFVYASAADGDGGRDCPRPLRARARPALSEEEEAACVSWLAAEGFFDPSEPRILPREAAPWTTPPNPTPD